MYDVYVADIIVLIIMSYRVSSIQKFDELTSVKSNLNTYLLLLNTVAMFHTVVNKFFMLT